MRNYVYYSPEYNELSIWHFKSRYHTSGVCGFDENDLDKEALTNWYFVGEL